MRRNCKPSRSFFVPCLFALLLLLPGCGQTSQQAEEKENWEALEDSLITEVELLTEVEATLYLPNEQADGFETVTETVAAEQGVTQGLVDALVAHGALPEGTIINDFLLEDNSTTIYGEDEEPETTVTHIVGDTFWITMDVSREYADALSSTGTTGETMLLGSLVNTLLDFYNAQDITLTCEGTWIETGHNTYDQPISFVGVGG